jgi:large subunit ribosomal protein L33
LKDPLAFARYLPSPIVNPGSERKRTMAKSKGRIIVTLECTEAKAAGKPVSRYTTTKNKTKTPGRLEKKKYNPNMQKHTVHRETK